MSQRTDLGPKRPRIPREEAKRRIVEATERLLAERPYRDLTVDLVMGEAGLSRTVFYRYFDGLPHVLLGVLEDLLAEIVDLTVTANRPGDPAVLREALARAVDVFARHGPLIHAVVEAAALDAEIDTAYRAFLDRSVDATAVMIDEGIERGGLRRVSASDVAALTIMVHHADVLGRGRNGDPKVALETIMAVWTGTLGFRGAA